MQPYALQVLKNAAPMKNKEIKCKKCDTEYMSNRLCWRL